MKSYIAALIIFAIFLSTVLAVDDDFSSSAYNKLTRQQKFQKIWSKVTENKTPYGWYSAVSLMKIFFYNMKQSFDTVSDNFTDKNRDKLIHSVGVVGRVELVAEQDKSINPYTGIFKGCTHVILRMSCAKEPDEKKRSPEQALDNFTPGLGIKFLRDSRPSGNTVSMYGVNGFPSWNWFYMPFTNHIASAEGVALKLLEQKFKTATEYVGMMGLKDMATYDQDGNDYSNNLNFPYKLIWKPSAGIKNRFPDHWVENFLTQLEGIPVNTELYELWVQPDPFKRQVQIGKLVLRDAFTRSRWGDKDLYFRHGYMDDDFAFHPEWNLSGTYGSEQWKNSFQERFGFVHP